MRKQNVISGDHAKAVMLLREDPVQDFDHSDSRTVIRPRTFVRVIKDLWRYKDTLIILGTPLVASILPVVAPCRETRCACVVIILAIYWMTEVVPMAMTALLPMVLFPVMGVSTAKEVANDYLQEPLFMLIGGLAIALAIEEARLHERVAMKVLLFVGAQTRWILLGIMLTAAFLSMWISNTATTATMIPIVEALLVEMIKCSDVHVHRSERKISKVLLERELGSQEAEHILDTNKLAGGHLSFCKMMLLSICYAANIGGIATITGTSPNVLAVGMMETNYGPAVGLSFASWVAVGFPTAFLNIIVAWLWLQLYFCGWKALLGRDRDTRGKEQMASSLRHKLEALGPLNWRDITTAGLFLLLVLLWLFRAPGSIPGWSRLFLPGFVTDSSAVIFVVFLYFVVPSEPPDFLCSGGRDPAKPPKRRSSLLNWPLVENRLPWGIILLASGSLAMAGAIERSGLSKSLSDQLSKMGNVSPRAMCAIVLVMAAFTTEVSSNSAAVSILVPLLCSLAENLHVNPLYFVLPAVFGVSFAFMLPVATAPNALVFGRGLLKISDMAVVGFVMNILSIIVTYTVVNTVGAAVFNLNTYPSWAPRADWNSTELMKPRNLSSLVNATI